jgi:nicotinamidase-related amidase
MRRIAAKGNRRSLRAGGSSGNRFTRSTYDRGIVGQCLKVMAMATVREGSKGVLVVVDVQVGVMNEAWDAPRVIGNVARAVERARAQGVPVIWVQHSSDELPHGSPQWQWVPQLLPAPGETLIHKQFNSSFEQTALEDQLARLGATHIALAGAATNWCIRATAYGALDRGYDLTLIADAHTTGTMTLDDGMCIAAANVIAELNVGMTWVSYPGRCSGTAKAEDVDFERRTARAERW